MLNQLVALITGGAQGLGRGFAESVLRHGGKVALLDSNISTGRNTESELRQKFSDDKVLFIGCDVTNKSQLSDAFRTTRNKLGTLNLLVNNAGIATRDPSAWQKTIDINLIALIDGCNLAAEEMKNGGHIVNIASAAGLMPVFFDPIYCASKHGVVGYSQSMAMFLKKKIIRVNCLCPETVDTPLVSSLTKGNKRLAEFLATKPIMSVEDIVKVFEGLIENEERNGEVLHISSDKGVQQAHLISKV